MLTRISYFLRETMVSLRRNLLMTIAGVITVAVSLSLFGGVMLLSKWVDHGTERIKNGVSLEIFMEVKATDQQIEDVSKQLGADPDVDHFRYLSKQDAYEEFKRIFADRPDLVKDITPEALPASFRVAPRTAELTPRVQRTYEPTPGVDEVATPGESLQGLLDATNYTKYIFWTLSGILIASSVFLIVNTIRLATFARRREIEVMKLVGASNWFVRVPFMAEGLVQGLIGAGLAIGAVFALKLFIFDGPLRDSSFFRDDFFVTTGNVFGITVIVGVFGVVIGLLGSAIGLRRFLRV